MDSFGKCCALGILHSVLINVCAFNILRHFVDILRFYKLQTPASTMCSQNWCEAAVAAAVFPASWAVHMPSHRYYQMSACFQGKVHYKEILTYCNVNGTLVNLCLYFNVFLHHKSVYLFLITIHLPLFFLEVSLKYLNILSCIPASIILQPEEALELSDNYAQFQYLSCVRVRTAATGHGG